MGDRRRGTISRFHLVYPSEKEFCYDDRNRAPISFSLHVLSSHGDTQMGTLTHKKEHSFALLCHKM